jgi:oligo-1,6-glucosidase
MHVDDIDREWWKEAVCYQIYPRSFNDTDGDGVGDLPGVIEKVDYLDELGVDVVWLNPIYESPNADNGYDIADYRAVMDEFGTMADWDRLLAALHDRGIRLIMDLVVNHTSDEHAWFVESREPDSEYRDWYWWREGRDADEVAWDAEDGPDGEAPPTAWESFFGGPAWTYDERSGEWYLHLFDTKQPDLNWETPEVRDAVFEMMEWWLEKGIDGFRMDVINLVSKVPSLPDGDPDEPLGGQMKYTVNGPKVHEYVSEMNERVLAGKDLLTVGEMLGDTLPMHHAREYVTDDGLAMAFHFEHMLLDRGAHVWETDDWTLSELKAVFDRWQEGLAEEGWNALYFNNHDQPRQVSRFGNDDEYRYESATLLGTLLHTLRGTPYAYQGEELGMTNYPFESLAEFRDVDTLNPVRRAIERGDLDGFEDAKEGLRANSRDNARTPMQWTDGPNAGFTDGEPWIDVNPNHTEINVEAARADPDSVFHYYKDLFALREYDVVVYGDYEQHTPSHESLWAYTRTLESDDWTDRLFVTLNFDDTPTQYRPSSAVVPAGADAADASVLLANYRREDDDPVEQPVDTLTLRPWEARVYRYRVD